MNKETKRVCTAMYVVTFIVVLAIIFYGVVYAKNKNHTADAATTTYIHTSEPATEVAELTTQMVTVTEPPSTTVIETETMPVYDDEIELLALVTMAEAEGESEYGKRLVIDTILNRVDSEHFPDTIYDVIYQPHQFTSMSNGRVDRCEVTDEVRQLVKEEMESRSNSEVIFFRTDYYSQYGTPLFQVGNHYFSEY